MLVDDSVFRLAVLDAWEERCAVCRLDVPRLLDASVIAPAHRTRGDLDVSNGLSLCALHREAFSVDLLSVAPDRVIHVAESLRKRSSGPIFDALGRWHGKSIEPSEDLELAPRTEFLAERFARFQSAA